MQTIFNYEDNAIIINHHDDFLGSIIIRTKEFYEQKLLNHIRENIKGGLFIDVGANIGNHTCFFSMFCADKVIAIEPVIENYELLLKNIKDNNLKNVITINKVLSNKIAKYEYKTVPINMGLCNMTQSDKGIDSITPENLDTEGLKLLKIDCENMSNIVLDSFIPTILKTKCDIIIEADKNEISNILNKIPYYIVGRFNATPTYHLKHK
jgi:FkbM family methyltransferase